MACVHRTQSKERWIWNPVLKKCQDYYVNTKRKKHSRRELNTALREVYLEPSVNRGSHRTKALVILSSRSLPLKQSSRRILYKSTFLDPMKMSRALKDTSRFPEFLAVQHIKTNPSKTTNSILTGIISGVFTLRDKKVSISFVNQKVRSITESVVSF